MSYNLNDLKTNLNDIRNTTDKARVLVNNPVNQYENSGQKSIDETLLEITNRQAALIEDMNKTLNEQAVNLEDVNKSLEEASTRSKKESSRTKIMIALMVLTLFATIVPDLLPVIIKLFQ